MGGARLPKNSKLIIHKPFISQFFGTFSAIGEREAIMELSRAEQGTLKATSSGNLTAV